MSEVLVLPDRPMTIEDVVAIAEGRSGVSLRPSLSDRIARGAALLEALWRGGERVYGVTTGVGEACERSIPGDLVKDFSLNLVRFHGCGLGRHFDPGTSAAILAVRLAGLCQGWSGVRPRVLELLRDLINHRILPVIPEEGSVGASGDLTPLSYVAAVTMGEREVYVDGEVRPAAEALAQRGLTPLTLFPKEALALMNGTSVMTALACLAYCRAEYLGRLASRLTAMVSRALLGNAAHFDPRIFAAKPHPGQAEVARMIAEDLAYDRAHRRGDGERIQDTYALRCAPHVIGVLFDALPWMRRHIEIEVNSANDNPLLDLVSGEVLHGGNFYGGHIGFAMDALKNAVANIADLMDRQTALLMDKNRNRGLPAELSGASPERLPVNHGFKAVHIGCSAWAAEASRLTMPASVFSRSTESHNQDKVSMGTIAARDAIRVLELTEQVLVSSLAAAAQALELRVKRNELTWSAQSEGLRKTFSELREVIAFVEEDRALEGELRALGARVRTRAFDVPPRRTHEANPSGR